MTGEGEVLEVVGVANDPVALSLELAEGGPDPEVVLEATDGWYWAADLLQAGGARVHLAHLRVASLRSLLGADDQEIAMRGMRPPRGRCWRRLGSRGGPPRSCCWR